MDPLDLNDSKAIFMGVVTASVTHEIQNVLAIIKENSGLMEDIILMDQGENFSGMDEKFKTCIDKIKKQAYRGVALTSGLNIFAHGPDHKILTINLVESVKKIIFVSERIFKLKGVDVQLNDQVLLPQIETDPFLFWQIIFSCMTCLADMARGSTLLIDFLNSDEQIQITISIKNNGIDCQEACIRIGQSDEWQKIILFSQKSDLNVKLFKDCCGIRICFPTRSS